VACGAKASAQGLVLGDDTRDHEILGQMRTAMMGSSMQLWIPATVPAKFDAIVAMMAARLDALKMTAAAGKSLSAVLADAQKKPPMT
jgi:hypothetical protein